MNSLNKLFITIVTIIVALPIFTIFVVGIIGIFDSITWKDPVTLFAAGSSALAALATSATLIFLVTQGGKQSRLWEFQKYQEHKREFFNLLSEIEEQRNLKFHNKSKLYSTIFNQNNYDHCSLSIDDNHFFLEELREHCQNFRMVSDIIRKSPDDEKVYAQEAVEHYSKILEVIDAEPVILNELGELQKKIQDRKIKIFNIFSIQSELVILKKTIHDILDFCNQKSEDFTDIDLAYSRELKDVCLTLNEKNGTFNIVHPEEKRKYFLLLRLVFRAYLKYFKGGEYAQALFYEVTKEDADAFINNEEIRKEWLMALTDDSDAIGDENKHAVNRITNFFKRNVELPKSDIIEKTEKFKSRD
ncbi:hypothetical protein BZJ19_10105 [Salinivibrio proteolyticus]|uniref:hypothetical protein n=1 Tax=Salinivibrio proteolyticus TaxID=334715 RepID=UPI000988C694|nr:hypothetical protein [Salinivibrio proteolyticus]OOF25063.1 hypothetical protein BZJ19_10105 [Salinivibrio proteolyticus]